MLVILSAQVVHKAACKRITVVPHKLCSQ